MSPTQRRAMPLHDEAERVGGIGEHGEDGRHRDAAGRPPTMSQDDLHAILEARHPDPFAVLGPHRESDGWTVRAFLPGAVNAAIEPLTSREASVIPMQRVHADGLFLASLPAASGDTRVAAKPPYRLHIDWPQARQVTSDPYAFGLLLGEFDLHLLREGRHWRIGDCLGAHPMVIDDIPGVRFAVWAPNASRVSVVGDFNGWDGRRHPMRLRHDAGVWELFVPELAEHERYKFEVRSASGAVLPLKADPLARLTEPPPATASRVPPVAPFVWHDDAWLAERACRAAPDAPVSIYEVHAGSWLPAGNDGVPRADWDALAERLIPYVRDMGFTHIEFLPVTEHPFAGSWGYQPLGLYAPTARLGDPAAFARLIDTAHCAGLGVILDWVPAHFPSDVHGLAHFDGTALYEHADPREGFHQDWKTSVYNLGRHEVVNFLIGSALDWLRRFHADGLRVDAVASMLYRDYSRRPGEWVPNRYGGRENLEAIAFLQTLSERVAEEAPGAALFAEESTAWPGVSAPVNTGGLGFDYKWNMGWMNDTLRYMSRDPIYRRHHHDDLTFGLVYAFSERFVLPLSHDEVVHGKGSLIGRMPGDAWQKHANLRAYFGFQWTHPGKKLLFMGGEFAQPAEWNHDAPLAWTQLDDPAGRGVQRWVRDLNRCYRDLPALHRLDTEATGFAWIIGNDRDNSVLAYLRFGSPAGGAASRDICLVVANFTPVVRHDYRVGVPVPGVWREVLNSDAPCYGGSGVGNAGRIEARSAPSHGQAVSLALTLPPLACLVLAPEK